MKTIEERNKFIVGCINGIDEEELSKVLRKILIILDSGNELYASS